jgi:hypothetical protein
MRIGWTREKNGVLSQGEIGEQTSTNVCLLVHLQAEAVSKVTPLDVATTNIAARPRGSFNTSAAVTT